MAKKYQINGVIGTKQELQNECKRILNAPSRPGPLHGRDAAFMLAAAGYHPTLDSPESIARIEIRVNPPYGSRGFWAIYDNGEERSFSYKNVLSDLNAVYRRRFNLATRSAVTPMARAFLAENFTGVCAVTGKRITAQAAHVDHAPPWPMARIQDEFVTAFRINLESDEYYDQSQPVWAFTTAWSARFIKFHNDRATLRIIDGSANSQFGAHGYVRAK